MSSEEYLTLLRRAKESLPKTVETERWEVPRAIVQIQGRRTFVKNLADMAKSLRRESQHIAKFLFKELAVPGGIEGVQLILQGKFGGEIINRRIEDYAKEFVLCHECGKPDTSIFRQGRLWFLKCEACGARRSVRAV